MGATLTTDTVERTIETTPEALYDIVSDVTRMPELSPEVTRCTWVKGANGPAVGARFRAVNRIGIWRWPNWPVVLVADPGREFTFSRTEPLFGTLEWRYRFIPEGTGTRVIESYTVTTPLTRAAYALLRLGGDADRGALCVRAWSPRSRGSPRSSSSRPPRLPGRRRDATDRTRVVRSSRRQRVRRTRAWRRQGPRVRVWTASSSTAVRLCAHGKVSLANQAEVWSL